MRAVVDTNLLVSGLLWGRNPGQLMAAASCAGGRCVMSSLARGFLRSRSPLTRSANAFVPGFKSCGCLLMLFSAFSI